MANYKESRRLEARRTAIFLVVVVLHLSALALLLVGPAVRFSSQSPGAPLEVVLIAPSAAPKVHLKYLRREDLSAHLVISPLLPELNTNMGNGPLLGKTGNDGSAVDWTAEAHRALKAFEIRRDKPPSNVIAGATRDEWWPQRGHHAGDRYKTENGDWIVWINSSCYQIASWRSTDPAVSAALPHTVCLSESGTQRTDQPQTPE